MSHPSLNTDQTLWPVHCRRSEIDWSQGFKDKQKTCWKVSIWLWGRICQDANIALDRMKDTMMEIKKERNQEVVTPNRPTGKKT